MSSIAKRAISLLSSAVLALCMTSSLSSSINANAWTESDGYTGREKANIISQFDDNYIIQNNFKAWSIYKSLGMTDTQAAAAMACIECESSFRSEIVEGHYESSGWTRDDFDDYVSKYSKKVLNADTRTMLTDDLLRGKLLRDENNAPVLDANGDFQYEGTGYGVDRTIIQKVHDDPNHPRPSVESNLGFKLSLSTYYDDQGVGWLGCGLFQFTGSTLVGLFQFADDHKTKWWEFDTQMSYIIDPNVGYKNNGINRYLEDTKDMTLNECVEVFAKYMINASMSSDLIAERKASAISIYGKFVGKSWDKKYGDKIISERGIETISNRTGIIDKGIIYSYASAVALYPRNSGFLINIKDNASLDKVNQEVYKGYINSLTIEGDPDTSKTYSLYERFGEDIKWYRYFGESTYIPNLLDHIWCAIDQKKVKDLISFDTINYDAYNYLSCQTYPDRPTVLSTADIDNGDYDARVLALTNGWFNGYSYVDGSLKLTISKYFVSMVSFLIGPELREEVTKAIEKIEESETWDNLKPVILIIVGLAMVAFIFSFVGKIIKYTKGQGAARDVINRFIMGVVSLGILGAMVASPSTFNSIINNTVNIVDSVFNAALADTIKDDEVIAVQDESKAVHAVLWKTSIFNAWCRGQFNGLEYQELYTKYALLEPGQSSMPQSHEQVDVSDQTGKAFYDSALHTGDVGVYVGGGKTIKNWAAYLYSCGTKYHIDSTISPKDASSINVNSDIFFPASTLKTTANDPNIAADLFRIIDAQMNVSPQYFADGSTSSNYRTSHPLETQFFSQSNIMLFNSALLLFMFPVIFKKILSFILLIVTSIKLIFYSILEISKEGNGFAELGSSIKKAFFDYFTACLKLNIMITLYYLFVDKGFFKMILYIILCIVVLSFNWKDAKTFINTAKHKVKRVKNSI